MQVKTLRMELEQVRGKKRFLPGDLAEFHEGNMEVPLDRLGNHLYWKYTIHPLYMLISYPKLVSMILSIKSRKRLLLGYCSHESRFPVLSTLSHDAALRIFLAGELLRFPVLGGSLFRFCLQTRPYIHGS